MNHQAQNSHHGSTSVVQLNSALRQLGLLAEVIPSKVKEAVAEVAHEVILARNVLHDEQLEEADEEKDLKLAVGGDGIGSEERGDAVGVGIEGVAGGVDVARDVQSGAGDDLAQEGELADAPVLDFDVSEAVESSLAGLVEESKRIEEAERRLGSQLRLEGIQGL